MGICTSSAYAESWEKIIGPSNPSLYYSTNATIDVAVDGNGTIAYPSDIDPDNAVPTSHTSTFIFLFHPSANNPTAPAVVSAVHTYSFILGPVEATSFGLARSFAMARLMPHPQDFNASSNGPATPLPTTTNPQFINVPTYEATIWDDDTHQEKTVQLAEVQATVSAYSEVSASIYPGARARASANNAAIRTTDVSISAQQPGGDG